MKRLRYYLGVAGLVFANGTFAAGAAPACGAVLCLSPKPGMPPPPECFGWRAPYFAIKIIDVTGFNAPATAAARATYLKTCVQARASDIARITKTYGMLPTDPKTF